MSPRALVPEHIAHIVPYAPGRPADLLQRELGVDKLVRLDSNENPLGPSPKALEAIARAATELHRYPDGGGFHLKAALSRRFDVPVEGLVLGNGSNELVELFIQAFCHDDGEVLTSAGSFIAYKLASAVRGVTLREVPLGPDRGYDMKALGQAVTSKTRLVFLANPNNPTGTHVDGPTLEAFIAEMDQRAGDDPPILVLDEAYLEYVDVSDAPDALAILRQRPRTIVLRTFSKAYGLAGIRCGYGITSPEIAGHIDRVRAPFNVSSLAQSAAIAALDDDEYLRVSVAMNRANRRWLTQRLRQRGLGVTTSETNFLLVDLHADAISVYESLKRRGVLTRPMVGYGFATCLRIGVGIPEENALLLAALDDVLTLEGELVDLPTAHDAGPRQGLPGNKRT